MADSVNYQYFQMLLQAFENAHPEKDKNTAQVGQIRPQRIAARRQRELLGAFQELEWAEMDDVDTEGLVIPHVTSIEFGTPVIESQEPCWSED